MAPGRVQQLGPRQRLPEADQPLHNVVVVRAGAADAPKELDPLETCVSAVLLRAGGRVGGAPVTPVLGHFSASGARLH
jgi:hypothetical protein